MGHFFNYLFLASRGRFPSFVWDFYNISQWSCSASGSLWEMPDSNPGPLPQKSVALRIFLLHWKSLIVRGFLHTVSAFCEYSTYTLLCIAVFKIFNIGQVSEREKLHLPGQCAGEADRHDRAPGGLVPRGPAHCRQKRHTRRQSGQKGKSSSSLQYVRICMNIIIIGIVEPPRF